MEIHSPAFGDGEPIPQRYTCDGEDISPPLAWSDVPEGTQSLALICDDPDAPGGTFAHWAVFDMPPDLDGLPEGYSSPAKPGGYGTGSNDFGRPGYGGPCPPNGHGVHHYHFRLLALDADRLELDDSHSVAELEARLREHLLMERELVGTYER
jgi:hypothetical protein